MILVIPDNLGRAPHDDGNDSSYPKDGRFYQLSFNVDFITLQAATVISSDVVSLFALELCTPMDARESFPQARRDMSFDRRDYASLRKFGV